ncbi:MAG: glutathione S-transferase [Rhodocyclaceae bacterium]|nr:glutathione S-transferase [Rhodocyclaceae bacterium]MBK9623031.1 glutathione S-transferase [Rhodocyclaceae bacterium]MBL0075587.1 glutathione S-transferase [Rhodocyclaceae bacterium]MBP6109435.1 glutathione S-transferase [Rhodocyclaceae bacterium]MBP6279118.1 glutathione S-transferase [Rhodocyclaceae bacterium]
MTHTLYGSQGSGSAAIEVALHLCDLPFRVVRASTWENDSAQAELARANPLKQIPTLILQDGSVLSESAAILIHLGLNHPTSGLLPNSPKARAQIIRGLVFIAANCYSAIGIIDYPERWTLADATQAHEALKAGAKRRLHATWEMFADTFASAMSKANEPINALDILLAVVSKWSGTRAHLAEHRPEFFAMLKRIDSHESVAPIFNEHWPVKN